MFADPISIGSVIAFGVRIVAVGFILLLIIQQIRELKRHEMMQLQSSRWALLGFLVCLCLSNAPNIVLNVVRFMHQFTPPLLVAVTTVVNAVLTLAMTLFLLIIYFNKSNRP